MPKAFTFTGKGGFYKCSLLRSHNRSLGKLIPKAVFHILGFSNNLEEYQENDTNTILVQFNF